MVEFSDGATIAQLSMPDMRLPIGLALGAPDRLDEPFGAIDWTELGTLTFETPDLEAFPCLGLAYAAGRAGGGRPGHPQRRQRGGGGGVPRRADPVAGHRRGGQEVLAARAPGTSRTSPTFSKPTGSRASAPGDAVANGASAA